MRVLDCVCQDDFTNETARCDESLNTSLCKSLLVFLYLKPTQDNSDNTVCVFVWREYRRWCYLSWMMPGWSVWIRPVTVHIDIKQFVQNIPSCKHITVTVHPKIYRPQIFPNLYTFICLFCYSSEQKWRYLEWCQQPNRSHPPFPPIVFFPLLWQ